MGTRRTERLGNLIQAELADLLLKRVKDPRLAGMTLTGVDVSPDLAQAKIYFSLLDASRRRQVEDGFKAAAPFLLAGDRALMGRDQILAELPGLIDALLVGGGSDWPSLTPAATSAAAEPAGGVCGVATPCAGEAGARQSRLSGGLWLVLAAALILTASIGLAAFIRRRSDRADRTL